MLRFVGENPQKITGSTYLSGQRTKSYSHKTYLKQKDTNMITNIMTKSWPVFFSFFKSLPQHGLGHDWKTPGMQHFLSVDKTWLKPRHTEPWSLPSPLVPLLYHCHWISTSMPLPHFYGVGLKPDTSHSSQRSIYMAYIMPAILELPHTQTWMNNINTLFKFATRSNAETWSTYYKSIPIHLHYVQLKISKLFDP